MFAPKFADNIPVVISVVALLSLIFGFAIFSHQPGLVKWARSAKQNVAYTDLAPIGTKINNYDLSASFAIQTSSSDASWVANNRTGLNQTLQAYMSKVNPSDLRSPNGVVALQESMKQAINIAYNTQRVQGVYVTNLAVQSTID